MTRLRARLRAWLGMRDYDRATEILNDKLDMALERADMALARIGELEKLVGTLTAKSTNVNDVLQQVAEVREMLRDPKRIPIQTRSTRQFVALMEQE